MPIYTKTGDKGMTSLFDGTRVKKASLRVEVYGTFDECCAQISLAQKMLKNQESQLALDWIQNKLFQMNAELATATKTDKLANKSDLISMEDIRQLEIWIDEKTAKLPPIHEFILPGKSLAGAQLHVARTVCRRGERVLDRFMENEEVRAELSKFTNRLSDCLYSFAREADHEQEQEALINKIIHRYQERVQQPKVKPDFEEIVHACIDHANCLSVPVSIAIVDKNGALKQFYRMDDALIVSESMAIKKAYTAVSMKADTHELTELVQPSQPLFQLETLSDGKLVTFGGGFLLKDGQGNIIGGVGVSGGRPDQDMAIATKGIKKFKERA